MGKQTTEVNGLAAVIIMIPMLMLIALVYTLRFIAGLLIVLATFIVLTAPIWLLVLFGYWLFT